MEFRTYLSFLIPGVAEEGEMTRLTISIVAILLISGIGVTAIGQKIMDSATDATKNKTAASAVTTAPGEDVFKANCSRCHAPPSSMSQRITGTVTMHMRVRARLSRQDEILLMRYLAP